MKLAQLAQTRIDICRQSQFNHNELNEIKEYILNELFSLLEVGDTTAGRAKIAAAATRSAETLALDGVLAGGHLGHKPAVTGRKADGSAIYSKQHELNPSKNLRLSIKSLAKIPKVKNDK